MLEIFNNTYTRGIGLMKVVWIMVEAVIDTRIIIVVQFHDILHGFCAGKATWNAIMEIKLAQELACVEQDLLLLVFL